MVEIFGVALPTAAATALATGLIHWGAMKASMTHFQKALNGTVTRIERIETAVSHVREDVAYLKGKHSEHPN